METIVNAIPKVITNGLSIACSLLPGVGFAMLAKMIMNKEVVPFFFLGFVLSAYFKVPVVGIAIIGLITVFLRVDFNNTNNLVVDENKFASIIITDEVLKEFGVDASTPSNLINQFNFIEDFYVWCFATEDKKNNQYKISIRSRGPVINKIANKHNGGGHNFASGARIKTREEVLELFNDLSGACREYEDSKL